MEAKRVNGGLGIEGTKAELRGKVGSEEGVSVAGREGERQRGREEVREGQRHCWRWAHRQAHPADLKRTFEMHTAQAGDLALTRQQLVSNENCDTHTHMTGK